VELDQYDGITPLISEAAIQQAVSELAAKISTDYQNRQLTLLGVLSGSIVLVADLMRRITMPHQLGLIQASSYRGAATEPGELALDLSSLPDPTGRDILLVDDILDTGRTMQRIIDELSRRGASSVRCAVLLWKRARTSVSLTPDYFCFEIPDEFVVGYGMDYDGEYRHLPFIGTLHRDGPITRPSA